MLVVKPVASVPDPTRPRNRLARDRLGIIQANNNRSRLDPRQRRAVQRRRRQQRRACLEG